jgi:hypothetical protein
MAIEEKKYEPGQIPTNIVRGTNKSFKIVSNLQPTLNSSTREAQLTSASQRTSDDPFTSNIDNFENKKANETNDVTRKSVDREAMKDRIKNDTLKEITAQEHENANNKAQSIVLHLVRQVFPEGLKFFERSKELTQDQEEAKKIAQEDNKRIHENPSRILEVLQYVIPEKLSETKKKAQASGDPTEIAHYDRVDEILAQIFDVMKQVSGKGSHTALLGLIESLDQTKIKGDLHKLITDYHGSLGALGKQIQRASAQLLNRTRHPQSELITGVSTKIDEGLRRNLYTRPESLGAAHRDNLGGIMGSIYDFRDTDWTLGSNTWEYGANVKGNNTVSASYPIRRLAGEMRGYIGQLTEAQPGPMFVTTDVDAKLS